MKAIKFFLLVTTLTLLLLSGCNSPTPTEESTLWLGEANPNPMEVGGSTSFEYRVSATEDVSMVIINSLGQEVFTQTITPENGSLAWNGQDRHGRICGEGIYYCKLATPSFSSTSKLLLIKAGISRIPTD